MDRTKPVVLFTTPVLHHPPIGGPALRIENSIKALSKISELHLYSRVSLASCGGTAASSFYRQYCQSFHFAPSAVSPNKHVNFAKRAVNFLARRIIKRNLFGPGSESLTKDFAYLLRVADAIQADVIWLGYGNISYPLLEYIKQRSNYRVVVDTDSVWSRFVLRELTFVRNAEERQRIEQRGKEKEEEERWGTQLADATTAVSQVDAAYYRVLAQNPKRVHQFSNAVDVDMYQQAPPAPDDFKKPCIYLAGTFWRNSPMEDATRWFVEKAFPVVRAQIPEITLYVVGRKSDVVLSDIQLPNVVITGEVESVLPYLCHSNVAIVPLRFESGTRFKILEAGACKIPVVSTTLGAEGLPVEHEKHLLLADEPAKFAQSIIRLIYDREFATELAGNLHQLVVDKGSISVLVKEATEIIGFLQDE